MIKLGVPTKVERENKFPWASKILVSSIFVHSSPGDRFIICREPQSQA